MANAPRADEQVVIVMSNAFFPAVSYVEVGHTVRFVNTTTEAQTIVADDAAWSIGPLKQGEEAVLTVVEGISLGYKSATRNGVDGSFSFAPTPMN